MDDEQIEYCPPTAVRVARRALVLSAVACRGFLEKDAGNAGAEAVRTRAVDWLERARS